MEFNRNHYLILGVLLLLLGFQLRSVDSYVLNEPVTRFLATRFGDLEGSGGEVKKFMATNGPLPRKEIRPPQWLGWALMSIGAVLTFQSLAMRRPG